MLWLVECTEELLFEISVLNSLAALGVPFASLGNLIGIANFLVPFSSCGNFFLVSLAFKTCVPSSSGTSIFRCLGNRPIKPPLVLNAST